MKLPVSDLLDIYGGRGLSAPLKTRGIVTYTGRAGYSRSAEGKTSAGSDWCPVSHSHWLGLRNYYVCLLSLL